MTPLAEYFADELQRARDAAGMTQAQLATATYVSKSTVAMIETSQRIPQRDFAVAADKALATDGRFQRMLERLLRAEVTPEWFRPWSDIEQQATVIQNYGSTVIPGLLQIEEYARALTGDDDATAVRMARQEILSSQSPPEMIVIVDEAVLHRQVGTADMMSRQLQQLTNPPATVCVQVLPADAATYLGVDGPFVLATVDGRDYVYVHTPARGFVLDSAEVISDVRRRWDVLRGEALPQRQSRELILKVAERWQSES